MPVSSGQIGELGVGRGSVGAPPARKLWQRTLVALSVIALAAFAVVATVVPAIHVRQLSILDEAAHIDSVFKVPAIDRSGEKFSPQTLDEVSCRGGIAEWPDWDPPPCGTPQGVPPDNYQVGSGGYNTADIRPPTYYYLTAALSTVAGWFGDADPVTLMRLTGAVCLAVGVCLTWLLARRLGANRWAAWGACGLLAAAPNVLYMSSIVNVDASVIMASAVSGLVALAVWRRRSAWWLLPLFAGGLMLVKMTNLGALIVVALLILIIEGTAPIRATPIADPLRPVAVAVEGRPATVRERRRLSPSMALVGWRSVLPFFAAAVAAGFRSVSQGRCWRPWPGSAWSRS